MEEISPTTIWACLGIALIVIEIFSSTFFLLFFGISALVVALIRVIGLDHLAAELTIFALIGMAGTLVFRKKILKSFASKQEVNIDKDKVITLSEDIAAHQSGSIQYRGSPWSALNDSDYDLKKGDS
ncbi:hypothetical protein BVY03_05730, partial [bacterium K02(2017)]